MTDAPTADPRTLRSPLHGAMDRIPGGTMVIPLSPGAIVGTTAPADPPAPGHDIDGAPHLPSPRP